MFSPTSEKDQNTLESKVVLLGDTGVGKTSISQRFTQSKFDNNPMATVGANYAYKTLYTLDNRITLQIWDTAGQERYRSLAPMYYRGAEAAIVVFDMTQQHSLESARSWIEEIVSDGDDRIVLALVGNKSDLKELRQIPTDVALEFARRNDAIYFEVSAKDGTGVDSVFLDVANRLVGKKTGGILPHPRVPSGSVIFSDLKKKESSNCCS